MANRHRGEIAARLGGRERTLRLTLGALAELETAFGAEDLVDLARRFGGGALKARDAIRVIGAGLRGAGEPVTDGEVAAMAADGGAAAYAEIVVRLLAATFGVDDRPAAGEAEAQAGGPFADPPDGPSPGPPRSPSASAGCASPPTPSGR